MPVLALGFRPFYLLAALFAVLAMPLWLGWYTGTIPASGAMTGIVWHMHEMAFGFAPAVIAGFLLTAVRNWTGLPTPTGARLALLVALWFAGRVLILTGPPVLAAVVDLSFLPTVGIAIAVPIRHSRNVRNLKVLAIVAALTLANALYHLAHLNALPYATLNSAASFSLDVIAILIALIGGRIIPVFTANAIPSAKPHRSPAIEFVAIGSLVVIAVGDLLHPLWPAPTGTWKALFVAATLAHGVRLALWAPHRTLHNPLLLMLPIGYAWLPISLALRVLEQQSALPASVPVHALTIGAMGSLMLAMMTRSALGHTGRTLVAGPAEIAAFVAAQLAAVIRVLAVSVPPDLYRTAVIVSGALWTLAFAIFLVAYWPILTRPRVDSRPG